MKLTGHTNKKLFWHLHVISHFQKTQIKMQLLIFFVLIYGNFWSFNTERFMRQKLTNWESFYLIHPFKSGNNFSFLSMLCYLYIGSRIWKSVFLKNFSSFQWLRKQTLSPPNYRDLLHCLNSNLILSWLTKIAKTLLLFFPPKILSKKCQHSLIYQAHSLFLLSLPGINADTFWSVSSGSKYGRGGAVCDRWEEVCGRWGRVCGRWGSMWQARGSMGQVGEVCGIWGEYGAGGGSRDGKSGWRSQC